MCGGEGGGRGAGRCDTTIQRAMHEVMVCPTAGWLAIFGNVLEAGELQAVVTHPAS